MTFAATIATELSLESDFDFTMESDEQVYSGYVEDTVDLESMERTLEADEAAIESLHRASEYSAEASASFPAQALLTATLGSPITVITGNGSEVTVDANPLSTESFVDKMKTAAGGMYDNTKSKFSTKKTGGFGATVMATIRSFFKRILSYAESYKNSIVGIFKLTKRLKAKNAKLLTRIEIYGKAEHSTNILNISPALANKLFSNPSSPVKIDKRRAKSMSQAAKRANNFLNAYSNELLKFYRNKALGKKMPDMSDEADSAYKKMLTGVKAAFAIVTKGNKEEADLMGGYMLSYTRYEGSDDETNALSKLELIDRTSPVTSKEPVSINRIPHAALKSISSAIDEVLNSADTINDKVKVINDQRSKVANEMKGLAESLGDKVTTRYQLSVARYLSNRHLSSISAYSKYLIKLAIVYMDLISSQVKGYTK